MLSKSMFLGLVVLASACAAEAPAVLSPQGEQVRYEANASTVANCTAVGDVKTDPAAANDTMGSDYLEEQRAAAKVRLRNEAGRLGANVVYVDEKAHPHLADGTAYKCPP
jgi:hypothetical protein